MNALTGKELLNMAHNYALMASGCVKVQVGAIIVKDGQIVSMGANRTFPDLCTTRGCMRIEKYGDNAKDHRLPSDCRALHSEADAIAQSQISLVGAIMYVTRYPCESCSRIIVASGIKTVYYGRKQKISEESRLIFESSHVDCWQMDWEAEDVEH